MKNKKYIAIFSGYYLPHLGGIERYISNLSLKFLELGYTPIIITSNYNNDKSIKTSQGIKIIKLPVYNIFKQRYPIIKKNREEKRLISELDNYDIKAIIVNTRFHLTSHIGASYGKKKEIPVYLIEHGSNYVTLDNKFIDFFANRYEDFLTYKIKKKITGFYGVSNACGDWLKKFKIKASGTWYNAIDTTRSFPRRVRHDTINFMYAGRIIKQKGVNNILRSFNKLLNEYDNIKLFIAGDGPELDSYKEKYQNEKIIFLGKLDFEELLTYYAKTDVFLYPPLWPEGLPTSILEAGIMKCAVIGTDQGGIREVITNDFNGMIVRPTAPSLYEAMKYLIDNPLEIKKFANNLYKTVNTKFSFDATAKQIIKDINI